MNAVNTLPDVQSLSADGGCEVLLVRVGGRRFALPLADVRYVAPMPPDFRHTGAGMEEHFVFDGHPLSYVSVWQRFGLESEYLDCERMVEMLPQRRQDHVDWMNSLEHSIRTGAEFSKARDPHSCAFGQWYYAYAAEDRRLALLLGQFEQPHAAIHGLAGELLGLAEQGYKDEALRRFDTARDGTLANLMKLFDAAHELVQELQRRLAIILNRGECACALGVDAVQDIVMLPAGKITPPRQGHGRGVAALAILDERSVVPLLDWQMMCRDG